MLCFVKARKNAILQAYPHGQLSFVCNKCYVILQLTVFLNKFLCVVLSFSSEIHIYSVHTSTYLSFDYMYRIFDCLYKFNMSEFAVRIPPFFQTLGNLKFFLWSLELQIIESRLCICCRYNIRFIKVCLVEQIPSL